MINKTIKQKEFIFSALIFASFLLPLNGQTTDDFPVLKHYDKNHLFHIALPLGGIGTGTVSLGGRGELKDWEIMNKPAKGFNGAVSRDNDAPFFALYVKEEGKQPITKGLMGPLHPMEYHHFEGRPVNQHGVPRFSEASFDAAYPFGGVNLEDKLMPVSVKIVGFNPLIPANTDASSNPIAVLKYQITNKTEKPITVSVCGTMRNFIGIDGSKAVKTWKVEFRYIGAKKNNMIIRNPS